MNEPHLTPARAGGRGVVLGRGLRLVCLLALDSTVNRHDDAPTEALPHAGGMLPDRQLTALAGDDATAGCLMGAVLALIILFGLGMALAAIFFSAAATPSADDPGTVLTGSR